MMKSKNVCSKTKPLSDQQIATINAINEEFSRQDSMEEFYSLNPSILAMHIRSINFDLWRSSK